MLQFYCMCKSLVLLCVHLLTARVHFLFSTIFCWFLWEGCFVLLLEINIITSSLGSLSSLKTLLYASPCLVLNSWPLLSLIVFACKHIHTHSHIPNYNLLSPYVTCMYVFRADQHRPRGRQLFPPPSFAQFPVGLWRLVDFFLFTLSCLLVSSLFTHIWAVMFIRLFGHGFWCYRR